MAEPPRVPAQPGRLRGQLAVGVVVLAFVAVLVSGLPTCPAATLLGVPCPGCGLTRATLAALRGDFHMAFRLHPLFVVLAPAFAGAVIVAALATVRGPSAVAFVNRVPSWLVTALGVVLTLASLGLWLARFFGFFGGPVSVR